MDTYGFFGALVLAVISFFRDANVISFFRDLFIKPHHPDDLTTITSLKEEVAALKKERDIINAIESVLDDPITKKKVEALKKVMKSHGKATLE